MAIETKTNTALTPFKDVIDILAPYPADKYHRLVPTAMQQRSPLYAPALQVVFIDPEDNRDVYPTPGAKDGTFCLHTQALERVANAIGIDFGRTQFEQHEKFWVTAHVPFEVIDALGQRRHGSASKTIDLRDGSIQADIIKGGLNVARQFINERAEAGARSRVTKKWTGMATSFTVDELRKPFVALRWTLDVNQPDVRKALIEAGTRASSSVFGGTDGGPLAIDEGDDDDVTGVFREDPAEPTVPETPAAPKIDISAIAAAATAKAKGRSDQTKATDDDLIELGVTLRDVLSLTGKLTGDELAKVRLSVARALYGTGVKTARELTRAQVRVIADMAKEPLGQNDLEAVFAQQLQADESLSGAIAAKLPQQTTLLTEARSL